MNIFLLRNCNKTWCDIDSNIDKKFKCINQSAIGNCSKVVSDIIASIHQHCFYGITSLLGVLISSLFCHSWLVVLVIEPEIVVTQSASHSSGAW